jgi:GNAT superfamily N-acetyltransferase/SAM-dependent methyltransferase
VTDLEIGLARADELSTLQEIEGRAGDLFRAHPVTAGLSLSVTPIERLERGRAESMLWVAREEARVVGFALVEDSGSAHHLEELDVDPARGRRGIGRRLVEKVIEEAAARDRSVTLTTFGAVPWNAPYYERLGFVRLSEEALDAPLRDRMSEEAARGLVRADRVAMRFDAQHEAVERSQGWEAIASTFMDHSRGTPAVGVAVIRRWAARFGPGDTLLDLACGPGTERSDVLRDRGSSLFAVDASPKLLAAYRARIPAARTAWEAAERTSFFERPFDGVLAWGLLFLLPADAQKAVIARVAKALRPRGSLLFTAPAQAGEWNDLSTERRSVSLGREAYLALLGEAGLTLVAEHDDEGQNHYYESVR